MATATRRRLAALLSAGLVAVLATGTVAGATEPVQTTRPATAPAPGAPVPTDAAPGDPNLSAEALGLSVVAGFDGQALRNTWMPVTVRLNPRSLFAGTVEVATDRGIVETREVEVAGGATKEFTFVVPSGTLDVRVRPDGSDRAVQVRPRVDGRPSGPLVGLTPTVTEAGIRGGALPNVELEPTGERAQWVTVDATLLERTHLVVGALGTLVLAPADVEALTDLGRTNLQRAVLDGLNLVVAAPVGPVATGLPWTPADRVEPGTGTTPPTVVPAGGAWTIDAAQADLLPDATRTGGDATAPAVAASVPAGLGRVVVTGLQPAVGDTGQAWAHLLAERDASFRLNGEHSTERGWIAQETLRTSGGLDVPSLGLLALFAAAYVLVVGPGNALLLKALGRRELGWVTIPVITVGFVGIAALVASGTQPRIGVAGGATMWVDGHGTQIAVSAVRAPNAGAHTLTLPGPDWQIDPVTQDWTGVGTRIDRSSGDVRATLELQSLQIGSIVAHRGVDEAPPLQVVATSTPDGVHVEVTNTSGRTIEATQVRLGGHRSKAQDLAPGESREWTTPRTTLNQLQPWRDVFQDARDPQTGRLDSPESFLALLSGSALAERPGLVAVTGLDPQATAGVLADGEPTVDLGRAVAVLAPIAGGSGDVLPLETTRTLLVGAFTEAWQPSPHAVEGELSAVLRYRLPVRAAGRVDALVADLQRGEGHFEGGFAPRPEPIPGFCVTTETTSPDGSTSGTTSCGEEFFEPPACPEDAIACDIGRDFWVFEFEDGTVVKGTVEQGGMVEPFPGGAPGNFAGAIEVYDHEAGRWDRLSDVLGDEGLLSASYLSPLGEVHVRASGGLFPFDFSARGVGAKLQGASA